MSNTPNYFLENDWMIKKNSLFWTVCLLSSIENGGFENGSSVGWTVGGGNRSSVLSSQIQPEDYLPNGARYEELIALSSSSIVTQGNDPLVKELLPCIVYTGTYAWRVGDMAKGTRVAVISRQVDNYYCSDIYFAWLAYLEVGDHPQNESSVIIIELKDISNNETLLSRRFDSAVNSTSDYKLIAYRDNTIYTPVWQVERVSINQSYQGHNFTLTVLAANCREQFHSSYVYIDSFGSVKPSTCNPPCQNNGTCTIYHNCTCAFGFTGQTCNIQSANLCSANNTFNSTPIILVTFGSGRKQYSSASPASFNFSTTYMQVSSGSAPNNGYFAFVNSVPNDFSTWHIGALDHTEDTKGYMFLVNAAIEAGQFYNSTTNHLCINKRYEFSVYLANLCKQGCAIMPNVRFEVRSASSNHTLLAQLDSGAIPMNQNTLDWKKYGLSFIAPTNSVTLLMISNAGGGDGNDLVIDDIALRVCAAQGAGFC
ncbi:unnamed protein product [Adineta ricciae]|uniref:EGF-like domain-containing protein n=1 Tax=Adineta ricciae TaxID=249248 RepID=A0A814YD19_ADIRI|nr:unnamed protein product [Adineta ricciae]CAF1227824.1 unnamed protein product [Adineta ricciae]